MALPGYLVVPVEILRDFIYSVSHTAMNLAWEHLAELLLVQLQVEPGQAG